MTFPQDTTGTVVESPDLIDAYCTSGTSPTGKVLPSPCVKHSFSVPSLSRTPADEPAPVVHCELVGLAHLPTVVVLGGISAGRHVCSSENDSTPGWWDGLVGIGKAIDTNEFRVLGIDWLGGVTDREDWSTPSRVFTTPDQADAIAEVLDRIGITQVVAVVGSSYGGMVALAFASRHAHRTERVVSISGAHQTHPMATALRSLQRRVVRLGETTGEQVKALSIARGIAMTTYRSSEEFSERFPVYGNGTNDSFPVEAYLSNRGEVFTQRFDATSFLNLSESIDRHDVDPSTIDTQLTLVAVDSDTLVPARQLRELAAKVGGACTVHEIRSRFGHDAFLKETGAVGRILEDVLGRSKWRGRRSATASVRAAIGIDREHGSVMPPLHLSANFSFHGIGRPRAFDYTRSGNPTRASLGSAIAELEGGAGGVITSSGMSALVVVTQLVRPGETVLAPLDCYGGTRRLLDALADQGRFKVVYAWLHDVDAARKAFVDHGPSWVLVETPSNPLLRVTDLSVIRSLCDACDALLVVDNTFLSPALQTPIEYGADIVVHSTTKFLNGHSDVVGGAVVCKDPETHKAVAWWTNCLGLSGAPFDSYLTLRGIRTLHARVAVHATNTAAVVNLLAGDPRVKRVYHPSLATHPGHDVALRQQQGGGSIVSFELSEDNSIADFVSGLECFSLAESLGGVESLIAHPSSMTHASMSAEARAKAGISDGLLRLSIGIEEAGDLVRDLAKALDRVEGAPCIA